MLSGESGEGERGSGDQGGEGAQTALPCSREWEMDHYLVEWNSK